MDRWAGILLVAVLTACTAVPVPSPPASAAPSLTILEPTSSEAATATATPSVSPTETPTPVATPTQVPATPMPTGPARVVYHGDRASRQVALTFDVGDPVDPFVSIMTWLRDNQVPATIFIAGRIVDSQRTDAGRQALALIEANPDLFLLGSHGYLHPDMREWSADQIVEDLRRVEAAVAARSSLDPRPWFRPPSGYTDAEVNAAAGSIGYRWNVLWDVDPFDWKAPEIGGPSTEEIVDVVVGQAQGGSIVLLHVGRWATYEALPNIVRGLRSSGYELVTLEAMLGP